LTFSFQYNGAFTASEGWFRGFLRRKNYTLRRISTTGRDFLETIVQFHKDCEINFIDNALINMDETSVYVDKPSDLITIMTVSLGVNAAVVLAVVVAVDAVGV
jgi:hypothetical protein